MAEISDMFYPFSILIQTWKGKNSYVTEWYDWFTLNHSLLELEEH